MLGLDLELRLQEALVGPFSLDLLLYDLGRDRTVIVENRTEQTDHDHIGKLVTYAAGHDASVAVWIAAFREEHRQALDWLNQRSDANTQFFGIVTEAPQIDDSPPAQSLGPVAAPNDWQRATVGSSTVGASPRGDAYRAFFQELIYRLRTQHNFTKAQKGQPQRWYSFTSGLNGVAYSVSFAHGGRVRTEVYNDRTDVTWKGTLRPALRGASHAGGVVRGSTRLGAPGHQAGVPDRHLPGRQHRRSAGCS